MFIRTYTIRDGHSNFSAAAGCSGRAFKVPDIPRNHPSHSKLSSPRPRNVPFLACIMETF